MSNYHTQLVMVLGFLFLIILFQNFMNNDAPIEVLSNTSLISSSTSLGTLNQSNYVEEGESIFTTVRTMASFQVQTTNIFVSIMFWLLSLYLFILIYLLVHPLKS